TARSVPPKSQIPSFPPMRGRHQLQHPVPVPQLQDGDSKRVTNRWVQMDAVFKREQLLVSRPFTIEVSVGLVEDVQVAADGHPQAGQVGAEGEVDVVEVKAAEVVLVERDGLDDLAVGAEKHAVEGLHADDPAGR